MRLCNAKEINSFAVVKCSASMPANYGMRPVEAGISIHFCENYAAHLNANQIRAAAWNADTQLIRTGAGGNPKRKSD